MASYLERYLAGEYEAVWSELTALGAQVREEPLASDALAVAQETMRRAKTNVETIVERLRELNYTFAQPNSVLAPPDADTPRVLDQLERATGPLPLSVRVFCETVGSVNLMGSHPTLSSYQAAPDLGSLLSSVKAAFTRNLGGVPNAGTVPSDVAQNPLFASLPPGMQTQMGEIAPLMRALMGSINEVQQESAKQIEEGTPPSQRMNQLHALAQDLGAGMQQRSATPTPTQGPASDPLVFWPPESDDPEDFADWDGEDEDAEDETPTHYLLDIAPDAIHKAGESGGGPYQIAFPNPAIDGPLLDFDEDILFVDYLRLCFRWGGFPGLREEANPPAELAILTRDLLPL